MVSVCFRDGHRIFRPEQSSQVYLGLPVIATRRRGLPEIVEYQISGLRIDAERPAELANALLPADRRSGTSAAPGKECQELCDGAFRTCRVLLGSFSGCWTRNTVRIIEASISILR